MIEPYEVRKFLVPRYDVYGNQEPYLYEVEIIYWEDNEAVARETVAELERMLEKVNEV